MIRALAIAASLAAALPAIAAEEKVVTLSVEDGAEIYEGWDQRDMAIIAGAVIKEGHPCQSITRAMPGALYQVELQCDNGLHHYGLVNPFGPMPIVSRSR